MKWKAPTPSEQRGFTGVYDAEGHRADVIALLQGGRRSAEIVNERVTGAAQRWQRIVWDWEVPHAAD